MNQLIEKRNTPTLSPEKLAAECARVSDKLNNLLTASQLRASMLLEEPEMFLCYKTVRSAFNRNRVTQMAITDKPVDDTEDD